MTNPGSHVWLPYAQMKTAPAPLCVERTSGSRIVLSDGRELIDGIASWWSACHGYNHPHIRAAVNQQLERMPHVMLGGLVHEPVLTLCRRLAALLPGGLDHVFLSDSGSVAVEVAMKMAIQYWLNRGVRGRNKVLAFKGGYHGDTFAAMSVCDPEEGMHALFSRRAAAAPRHGSAARCTRSAAQFEAFVDAARGRYRRHPGRAPGPGGGRDAVSRGRCAAATASRRRSAWNPADLR
jgi:adenosylmethionine-8-amino-7-oxononanoate aminotransferase